MFYQYVHICILYAYSWNFMHIKMFYANLIYVICLVHDLELLQS